MAYDIGDSVPLSVTVRNADGVETTPSTISLTIVNPDGTSVTPAVPAPTSPGAYRVIYTPTAPGRYRIRWAATAPDFAHTDVFDVRPDDRLWLVSLADARAHLNLDSSTDDSELRDWIGAATRVVENYAGRVFVRRQFTETLTARGGALLPNYYPVVSVQSPTNSSTDGLYIYNDYGSFSGSNTVTYTAGPDVPPENATRATLIVLKHMWDTQRALMPGDDFTPNPGMGYSLPNRAKELLGTTLPGVA